MVVGEMREGQEFSKSDGRRTPGQARLPAIARPGCCLGAAMLAAAQFATRGDGLLNGLMHVVMGLLLHSVRRDKLTARLKLVEPCSPHCLSFLPIRKPGEARPCWVVSVGLVLLKHQSSFAVF